MISSAGVHGRLGVGVIGCGQAAQAIHLPALASLQELFRPAVFYDPVAPLAETVARRASGRPAASVEELLADPAVDVVLLCSPNDLHPDHAVAAIDAGKKGVLCEKPLASSAEGAQRVAAASRRRGVPVIVGTMHRHDPALHALASQWGDLPERASWIRACAHLSPNPVMVSFATEPVPPTPLPEPAGGGPSLAGAAMLRGLMLGLAIHQVPLVRMAMPAFDAVEVAIAPGLMYQVSLRQGERLAQLTAVVYEFVRNDWSFELWGPGASARFDYGASYLQAQSSTGELWQDGNGLAARRAFTSAHENGYRQEWRHLAAVVRGEEEPLTGAADAAEDIAFCERIAAAAGAGWGEAP